MYCLDLYQVWNITNGVAVCLFIISREILVSNEAMAVLISSGIINVFWDIFLVHTEIVQ